MSHRSGPYDFGKGGFGNKGKGKSKGEPVSEPVDENEMTLAEYAEYVKGKGKDGFGNKGKAKDGSGNKGGKDIKGKGVSDADASFLRLRDALNRAVLSEGFNAADYDLSESEEAELKATAKQQLSLIHI